MGELTIRQARQTDLEAVAAVEAACFPAAEAADRDTLRARIDAFSQSFLVAELDGAVIGFINGCVTGQRTITDDLFEDAALHRPDGAYQSIFGLDVMPTYRRQGIAARLMRALAQAAGDAGRRGMILTCKERLIPYYQSFGYRCLGVSASVHGGAVWYDMIWEFETES